jgi:protein-disulfide isomerase
MNMKRLFFLVSTCLIFLLSSCVSPKIQKQLDDISTRQDSIVNVLATMKKPLMRMGWEPPEDTVPLVIPIGDSYTQGAKNPILTIVEFSDFQCPYCARVAPMLDSLVLAYPEEIQVVFKHFPLSFHKQAMSAHIAAQAAGEQGRFYEFRYKIAPKFRNLTDSTYISLAQEMGLDVDQFKSDLQAPQKFQEKIQNDMKLGREVGVRGTPSLYVNGRKAKDRSYAGFEKLLKSLRK